MPAIVVQIIIILMAMLILMAVYPRILAIMLKIMTRNYRKCIINTAVY